MMKPYICFPNGKFKVLTMSYDDGKLEDRRLIEIFNRYHIKGTFHINSGELDMDGMEQAAKELANHAYPKEQQTLMEALVTAVEELDVDACAGIIADWKRLLD